MRIKNHRAIANRIAGWLSDQLYIADSRFHTAVLGLSGGIDSGLVALICKYANLRMVCVNMPCHSSAWSVERSVALARDFELPLISVEGTHVADAISAQVNTALGVVTPNRDDLANLFSCTRAPILDYVSKCTKGRIIGTGNRDEDNIIRYFSKRGDGAVDLSPIADLHKSEVRQMFAWLATNLHGGVMPESAQAILVAKPSADLWGGAEQYDEEELGLPYDLVEWVDEFVAKQDGGNFWSLNKDARESLLTFWTLESKCSLAEAGIIRKVSEIELYTKHKANPNIPVCPVRNLDAFEV